MPFSYPKVSNRVEGAFRYATVAALLSSLCGTMIGQDMGNFQIPKKHFPNPIAPYTSRMVPAPTFSNSPRLDQMIQNGRLLLSLDDAVALALENNLDLAIARYDLPIADTEILRAHGGATLLGVPTGLVTGTPGGNALQAPGAQGAGAGGTAAGVGGVGAGSAGIVQSTAGAGPAIEPLDPVLTGTLEEQHQTTPESNTIVAGVPFLKQATGTENFLYTQGFVTGTQFQIGFNNNRQASNSIRNTLNPVLNSNFTATLQQHLLQGFGISNQNRFIRIARNNRKTSEAAFRLQVIYTVSQVANIYWNLVAAYEAVAGTQQTLQLNQELARQNRRQVELGTLAEISIVQADSQVASSNQALIVAKTNLQLNQLEMINAISRNVAKGTLAGVEVIPTDTVQISPADQDNVPIEDLVGQALAQRPEIEEQQLGLQNDDISRKAARNSLLPTLDLSGFYGGTGLGGPPNALDANLAPGSVTPSGYGTVFSNVFNNTAPDKGIELTLNVPIRNRPAQATQARAEMEHLQAQLLLQQFQNTVSIQVRNAAFAVQQNRAAYEAAIEGRRLAAESLDAEQKKLALGASTTYNVLAMINALAVSDQNLVAALAAYAQSRVTLDQVTANILKRYNISIGDAMDAQVRTLPTVPGVVRSPAPGTPPAQSLTPEQQREAIPTSPPANAQPQGVAPQNPAPPRQ